MTITANREVLQAKATARLQSAAERYDAALLAARAARDAVVVDVARAEVLTVQQVADAVGLSRATVFRILKDARS